MCEPAEQQVQAAIGDNCNVPIDNKGGSNKLPYQMKESGVDIDEFAKGVGIAAIVAPIMPSQQAGADPEDICPPQSTHPYIDGPIPKDG